MTLIEKQQKFVELISKFELELISQGYGITDGEAWRSPETCELYAKEGRGISKSLHTLRLARDINLFKDGMLLNTFRDYMPAGLLWESYSTQDYVCAWGGRFLRQDVYHFSLAHNGVR